MRLCLPLLAAAIAVAQPAPQPPLARLEANIRRVTQSVNATWGIYIKCLETGEEIAIDADRQMDTMSVIKIPLMAEAFRQIGEGKFTARRPHPPDRRRETAGHGHHPLARPRRRAHHQGPADAHDHRQRQHRHGPAITTRSADVDPVNRLMKEWGLSSIRATGKADVWFKALRAAPSAEAFHREAKTPFGLSSPRDMGRLLEKLEKGEAVSKEASDANAADPPRPGLQLAPAAVPFGIPDSAQDRRLPALYRERRRGAGEPESKRIVMSVFTANHFGAGDRLEDAIGRIAELTGNYFAAR